MSCVAFDTLRASEDLEKAGLSKEQARAISHVVCTSHEVADVATKTHIAEVNRNVADVRKDMAIGFEKVKAKAEVQITLLRKDMEFLTNKLLINTTKIIIGCVGLASAIVTLIVKFF